MTISTGWTVHGGLITLYFVYLCDMFKTVETLDLVIYCLTNLFALYSAKILKGCNAEDFVKHITRSRVFFNVNEKNCNPPS